MGRFLSLSSITIDNATPQVRGPCPVVQTFDPVGPGERLDGHLGAGEGRTVLEYALGALGLSVPPLRSWAARGPAGKGRDGVESGARLVDKFTILDNATSWNPQADTVTSACGG
jgi:hypothetical protein